MSKSLNPEKGKSLMLEINPQLFWAIFTALIGGAFFLGLNFGQQSSTKEVAEKDKQITAIASDTQNVYKRLIDSLRIKVTLLDTKTNSDRVSQLRNPLIEFSFIKTEKFGIKESLKENIQSKPDILIAHWHAYREIGNDAHDTASENLLLKTIEEYAEMNPDIKIIVFSSVFGDKIERERLTSKKISNLKEPVIAYPLHLDTDAEIKPIIAKVLSISTEKIHELTD